MRYKAQLKNVKNLDRKAPIYTWVIIDLASGVIIDCVDTLFDDEDEVLATWIQYHGDDITEETIMIVYLVWREDDVVGVFSSREKAKAFIDVESLNDMNEDYYYKIEEKEVQ